MYPLFKVYPLSCRSVPISVPTLDAKTFYFRLFHTRYPIFMIKNKHPPKCPFYKASGGVPLTGVPGIEPGSGVLETLSKMLRDVGFIRNMGGSFKCVPTFVPILD